MSLKEQQNFLARLFTDESLRQSFLADSIKIGAENGLNDAEIYDLQTILPDQIEIFSESLYWKRLRETEKFLPILKANLMKDFEIFFKEFSQNYHPQSVKKHLEDAFEFCKFLQKQQNLENQIKNIAKFEQKKLEFFGFGKRLIICRFADGLQRKSIHIGQTKSDKPIKTALWLKLGKKRFEYFW